MKLVLSFGMKTCKSNVRQGNSKSAGLEPLGPFDNRGQVLNRGGRARVSVAVARVVEHHSGFRVPLIVIPLLELKVGLEEVLGD